MQKIEPIVYDRFYHIYNRGINGENLFTQEDNYLHFLRLYDKYIHPVADTYAWVLMPNHFHLLVRIKEEKEFGAPNLTGFQNLSGLNPPFQHFSNLFNAYTKAFNKRHARHGALFERPFKRKLITDEDYLRQVVVYIHNNPVHHGFCEHPIGYPWSSYAACVSIKPTKLHRNDVVGWFDGRANFIAMHRRNIDRGKIEEWLKING